jgi:hypothetical protein
MAPPSQKPERSSRRHRLILGPSHRLAGAPAGGRQQAERRIRVRRVQVLVPDARAVDGTRRLARSESLLDEFGRVRAAKADP